MQRMLCAGLAVLLVATAAVRAGAGPAQLRPVRSSEVAYTLSMPEPATHLFSVKIAVPKGAIKQGFVDLSPLPVWTPGSYLVREFARQVQDFEVFQGSEPETARPRPGARWEKIDKNTWRVWPDETKPLSVSYRVYANELSVRTSHLDESHGYVNPANLFMYVDGMEEEPIRLTVAAPKDWLVATALPRGDASGFVFTAPDYDTLADSPIETGRHRLLTFEAAGKPHEIAIWGKGNYDPDRLTADFKKIVEAAAAIFGGTVPYDRYVFVVQLFPGGGGGLEHASSTTVQSGPFIFTKKEPYRDFLELVAHEYFHLWLVKRIRPAGLTPFDYEEENYTKLLWLMEGTTDYYAPVILRRAGLMTEEEFNKGLAKSIQTLEQTPGRKHLSLEEASFDAWIKYYRQNEHSVNNQVSYYLKGAIVSAMLDFEIQGRTGGKKSLDDVMRYLWETYGEEEDPLPENGVQPAVEAVAGSSFEEFFSTYIRGTDEIDYGRFLGHVKLKLVAEVRKDDARIDPAKPGGWIGATVSDSGGRTTVTSVLEDWPAWKAGLNTGDELLAFNGVKTTAATLNDRLAESESGTVVKLTVFRRDELRTIEVPVGTRPPDTYKIEKIEPAAAPK